MSSISVKPRVARCLGAERWKSRVQWVMAGGLPEVRFNHNHSMVTNSQNKWWCRCSTLVVWAVAAASIAWWGLRLTGASHAALVAPSPVLSADAVVDAGAVARLLGAVTVTAADAAPGAASRFSLLGIVAGAANQGAALIAIDGKPGRPYRVGSKVEEGLFLQSVEPRRARLAPSATGPASMLLEMPPLTK
jgi:general secretion pathway protein C